MSVRLVLKLHAPVYTPLALSNNVLSGTSLSKLVCTVLGYVPWLAIAQERGLAQLSPQLLD
jgi:hypothetical protein